MRTVLKHHKEVNYKRFEADFIILEILGHDKNIDQSNRAGAAGD